MKTIWLIRVNKIVLCFHYYTFPCKETDVPISLLIKQTFIVDFPCVDIDNRVGINKDIHCSVTATVTIPEDKKARNNVNKCLVC